MKLDLSYMRHLTQEDFNTLNAVQQGSRNHELVPTALIHKLSKLKSPSATGRCLGDLAKLKLVSRLRNAKYDGFRITYQGYDYLALRQLTNGRHIYAMGTKIGVGKESDIYIGTAADGVQKVIKIHRLGRTSFKTIKHNRDYLKNRHTSSWMYLSSLAAEKEYEFMCVLFEAGFNVPRPYALAEHCVAMLLIKGYTMKHMKEYPRYKQLYSDLMKFIVKLANHGLIHCDYNEFNIMICDEEETVNYKSDFVVIDFPQCVSIDHVDAQHYFDRDVKGIRDFFYKKFLYKPEEDPSMLDTDGFGEGYKFAYPNFKRDVDPIARLDAQLKASGYCKPKDRKAAEDQRFLDQMRQNGGGETNEADWDSQKENEQESEDDDGEEEEEEDDQDEYEEDQFGEEIDVKAQAEENEKIISAISAGSKNLKMDKLGNYVLEE